MIPYSEQLKDPRWQKKRLEILQRDEFKCVQCDDEKSQLHVHHVYYLKGKYLWDYPDILLVTVCKTCHAETPLAIDRLRESVRLANPKIISGFAAELEQCEPFTGPYLQILTALLQDYDMMLNVHSWYGQLPINRKSGERDDG